MSELLNCPFCGGKPVVLGGGRHVHCGYEGCFMTSVWAKAATKELAAQCWNTRAVPPGYALVPIEPTETMVVNGFESWPDPVFSKAEEWQAYEAMSGCQQAAHKARLCYAAMLDAAPTGD